ncbi:DUF1176 domain-containing protein, partial [Rhizobiaceae sp. 2RAB30]
AIQGVPFQPLHLEKGELKPAQGELSEAVPAQCGDGPPAQPRDALKEQAEKIFAVAYGPICRTLEQGAEPGAAEPEIHEIGFHFASDAEGEPERKARLFKFDCGGGAYNTNEVYYLAD